MKSTALSLFGRGVGRVVLYIIVVLTLATMVYPLIWMISTSLKTYNAALSWPPRLIPAVIYWKSYVEVLETHDLARYFLNTTVYAVVGTSITVFLSIMAGFAYSKYRFPLRDLLFTLTLSTLMIPFQVTLIPLFIIVKNLGWLNTFFGLIIPGLANPFGIFLIRQFGRGVPDDLFDAARIDGCGEFRMLMQVFVPLCLPAITTLSVLEFLNRWNDLFWPLIVTTTSSMTTMQLALTTMSRTLYDTIWNNLMAGATMATIPVIVLYVIFQRYFTRGIVLTGMKG